MTGGRECLIHHNPLWTAIKIAEWNTSVSIETELCFSTPIGEIRLATPSWLSTVSGIQFQYGDNAPHPALLGIAVAALPSDLTALWGGAWLPSLTQEETSEPLIPLLLEAVDAQSTHHAALIRMRAGSIVSLLADSGWRRSAICESQPPHLDAVPAHFYVTVGTTRLYIDTLAGLHVGDAIFVQTSSFDVHGKGTISLDVAAMCVRRLDDASCHLEFIEWDAARVAHTSGSSRSFSYVTSAHSMIEKNSDLSRQSSDEKGATSFEDIPVTLAFIVGTLQSTIGELRVMAPGHVLEWRKNTQGNVVIEANGALVGYGELIEVDGALAVELTHWSLER